MKREIAVDVPGLLRRWEKGESTRQIAQHVGLGRTAIQHLLATQGISRQRSLKDRFLLRRIVYSNGCWGWTSRRPAKNGYNYLNNQLAHRIAYELYKGRIPDGLTLDHLCRHRWCVNPDHLEAVTNRENILRGTGASARNAIKTVCKWGHPFTPENTAVYQLGCRTRRACVRRRARETYKRRRSTT